MNLVVVYLTKVREHIIIPESYIYGFNLKALKNFGRNACRDQLVYWSDECIEGEHYPDPKTDAAISENWPAETGAWFHARTIYYTDDIEEAKQIKEKRRRILPGVYNPARLNERPLPLLVLMPDAEQQQSDDENSIVHDPNGEPSLNLNYSGNSTDTNIENLLANQQQQSDGEHSIAHDSIDEPSLNSNDSDNATVSDNGESVMANQQQQSDAAHQITQNSLDETPTTSNNLESVTSTTSNNDQSGNDESQFDNESNSHSNHDQQQQTNGAQSIAQDPSNRTSPNENVSVVETATEPPISSSSASGADASTTTNMLSSTLNDPSAPVKPEPIFAPLVEENAQAVDDIFNGSFENCDDSGDVMILSQDIMPIPKAVRNPYEVKQSDLISGNMAFATNDVGDRSYIVTNGTKWKQMALPVRIVKGLRSFNMEGFRQSIEYDRKFIKILLSSCNGINNVRLGILDPFAVDFIKDLFRVRCGDEERVKTLDELIKICCDELGERFK